MTGQLCEWFAMCQAPATTTVNHPVLGKVPCCGRCAERQEVRAQRLRDGLK